MSPFADCSLIICCGYTVCRDFGFVCDGPHEAAQFSCDGRYDNLFDFAFIPQVPVARTQPELGFPCNVANGFRQAFLPFEQYPADPGR
jgi:hypothetical protein